MRTSGAMTADEAAGAIKLLNADWVDPLTGGIGSVISLGGSWAIFIAAVSAALALVLTRRAPWPAALLLVGFGWEIQVAHAAPQRPHRLFAAAGGGSLDVGERSRDPDTGHGHRCHRDLTLDLPSGAPRVSKEQERREEPPVSLRALKQPGPAAARRFESVCTGLERNGHHPRTRSQPQQAIARPLLAAGWTGGSVCFTDGWLAPFHFVMPAPGRTKPMPPGTANPFAGRRGADRAGQHHLRISRRGPLHPLPCHMATADGVRGGGHILPLETQVSRPITARAFGSRTARIAARPDAEPISTLFTPESDAPAPESGRRLILARLRAERGNRRGARRRLPRPRW